MRKYPRLPRVRAQTGDSSQRHTAVHARPSSPRRWFRDGDTAAARPCAGPGPGALRPLQEAPGFRQRPRFLAARRPGKQMRGPGERWATASDWTAPRPHTGLPGSLGGETPVTKEVVTGNRPDHAPGELSLNGGRSLGTTLGTTASCTARSGWALASAGSTDQARGCRERRGRLSASSE